MLLEKLETREQRRTTVRAQLALVRKSYGHHKGTKAPRNVASAYSRGNTHRPPTVRSLLTVPDSL